jgi:formylglycine-generating enzyme required for sulfatase activity
MAAPFADFSHLAHAARPEQPAKPKVKVDRVLVPGGPFVRGSIKALDERPRRSKTLGAFHIDRTEVTYGMYEACVAAQRCRPLASPPPAGTNNELPVTGVSFDEARAFCRFAKGRLPNEDEWEKAARGADGREFPWGNEATCTRANWGNFDGEGPCREHNPGKPAPVGSYPSGQSPYGIEDLAGNVWEWVDGRYEDEPDRRIVRGGSCCSYFVEPRAANRNAFAPDHRDADLGFRCVAR